MSTRLCLIFTIYLLHLALSVCAIGNEKTVCLYDSITLLIKSDCQATAFHHIAFKFGDGMDIESRNLKLAMNKHIKPKKIDIETVLPDGHKARLDEKDINVISDYAPDYFADSKTIIIPIPFAVNGAVTIIKYEIDYDCLLYLPQYIRQREIPIENAYFCLKSKIPFALLVPSKSFSMIRNDDSIVVFADFIPESQNPSASFFNDSYRIVIRPDYFAYDGKTYRSKTWRDVAEFYYDIFAVDLSQEKSLSELASEICKTAESANDSVAALNRFVKENIRYISADLGRGDFQPLSPIEVLKRKYGDCRDQASLLVALLDAAGFKSYPALVTTREKPEIIDSLPWPGYFNHVIAYVERPMTVSGTGNRWFLDPGGESCCDFVIPINLRKRKALVCSPGSNIKLLTLESDDSGNLAEIAIVLKELSSNRLTGEIMANFYRDAAFDLYSPVEAELKEKILERFPAFADYGAEKKNLTVNEMRRDLVSVKAKISGRIMSSPDRGELLFLPISPLNDYMNDVTGTASNDLDFPLRIKESINLALTDSRFFEPDSVILDFAHDGLQAHFSARISEKRCQIYRYVIFGRYSYDQNALSLFSDFLNQAQKRLPDRIPIIYK